MYVFIFSPLSEAKSDNTQQDNYLHTVRIL